MALLFLLFLLAFFLLKAISANMGAPFRTVEGWAWICALIAALIWALGRSTIAFG